MWLDLSQHLCGYLISGWKMCYLTTNTSYISRNELQLDICVLHCRGVFIRVKGEPMHPECYKCASCGISLKNQGQFYFPHWFGKKRARERLNMGTVCLFLLRQDYNGWLWIRLHQIHRWFWGSSQLVWLCIFYVLFGRSVHQWWGLKLKPF